jgi:protein-S-isoprenylcysteine O-methyltransferase
MNEKMLAQRANEMKIHKLIIPISTSFSIILGYYLLHNEIQIYKLNEKAVYIITELVISFILIIYLFISPKSKFKLDHIIGIILCLIFGLSISMLLFTKTYFYQLYLFLITQMIFHYSEYISVIIYHFDTLEYKSYLLDHSREWIFALIFNYLETILGNIYFYDYKHNKYIFALGIIITIIGQTFRIGALFTGKKNFTHLLSYEKQPEQYLMTTGFYGISRHPSYFGFWIWGFGTQLMCGNLICSIGFPIGLYVFFEDRIIEEEGLLIEFFGEEYIEYKKRVPILIPFVNMDKKEEQEHLNEYYATHPKKEKVVDIIKKIE